MTDIIKPAAPLPWSQADIHTECILSNTGGTVADCDPNTLADNAAFEIVKTNAEYIVTACNAFPELVKTLEALANIGGNLPDSHYEDGSNNESSLRGSYILECRERARAVLQSIQEGESNE